MTTVNKKQHILSTICFGLGLFSIGSGVLLRMFAEGIGADFYSSLGVIMGMAFLSLPIAIEFLTQSKVIA